MTTPQSLLYCDAAEVILERVKNLVAVTGTKPLTVEFKDGGTTPAVAECAAAMANLSQPLCDLRCRAAVTRHGTWPGSPRTIVILPIGLLLGRTDRGNPVVPEPLRVTIDRAAGRMGLDVPPER
jgi:hypothetical protein